MLTIIILLILY